MIPWQLAVLIAGLIFTGWVAGYHQAVIDQEKRDREWLKKIVKGGKP